MLDGIYGFVLYNKDTGEVYIARDPGYYSTIGWTPEFMVASECKSLIEPCEIIEVFRHSLSSM